MRKINFLSKISVNEMRQMVAQLPIHETIYPMKTILQSGLLESGKPARYKVYVTPQDAKEILDKHYGGNRKLKSANLKKYKKAMLEDKWYDNGQGLIFNDLGIITNAIHRLVDLSELNGKVDGIVFSAVFGIPSDKETSHSIDSGASRNTGDHICIDYGTEFIENGIITEAEKGWFFKTIGILVRAYLSIKKGMPSKCYATAKFTDEEVEEFFVNNKEITTTFAKLYHKWISNEYKMQDHFPSTSIMLGILFQQVYDKGLPLEKVNEFIESVLGDTRGHNEATNRYLKWRNGNGKGEMRKLDKKPYCLYNIYAELFDGFLFNRKPIFTENHYGQPYMYEIQIPAYIQINVFN